jgi:hypothetical protein
VTLVPKNKNPSGKAVFNSSRVPKRMRRFNVGKNLPQHRSFAFGKHAIVSRQYCFDFLLSVISLLCDRAVNNVNW